MKILAVDSSTSVAAVAVTEDGRLMGEYNIDSERTHSVNLVPMISDLLNRLQLKPQDIDLFAAVSGPGSFTGLRIGITAVKSMAYACGKSVVGIPSLDSLAYNIPVGSDIICPMIDARNRQVYMAAYRQNAYGRPERLIEYMAVDAGEASKIIVGLLDREMEEENVHGSPKVILLGDGAIINRGILEEALGGRCIFPPPEKMRMTASSAAAAARDSSDRKLDSSALNPFYMRPVRAKTRDMQLKSPMARLLPMEEKHLDAVSMLEKECFDIPWPREAFEEEIRGNKLSYYTVADVQGVIVGYAGIWIVADEAHIMNIAVLPAYRRYGIGSLLLNELISAAAKKNIGKMTLEVRKSNLAARALYRKFGFVPSGLRKAYYADNREDAVIMWKNDILEGN